MVQGEKDGSLLRLGPSTSRTQDPAARKAGFEAVQREMKGEGTGGGGRKGENYGAWGPLFKNKSNFSQLHLC